MNDLLNLDGRPVASASSPASISRHYRGDSIARIRRRVAGDELERLPDVYLIIIEHALNRAMREIDRYASHPGYLTLSLEQSNE